jgi:host factor-I protein
MTKQEINIQDGFLLQHLKAASRIRLTLVTGQVLEGVLRRFDRFSLVLASSGGEVLVYKHAVSTVQGI